MLLSILLLSVGLVPADWSTFEPASKAGRVSLPEAPDETTSRSLPGPSGPITFTSAQARTSDGVFAVRITESPARADPATLDEGVARFAQAQGGSPGPSRAVDVGGSPGREFEMTAGSRRSKVRLVLAGGTLFVLSATGMPGAGLPDGADRFLGSLRIGPPDAAEVARLDAERARAEAERDKVAEEAEAAREREAELAKAKMEAEIAKARAEADIAKARAEAEIARIRDQTQPNPKAQAEAKDKGKGDFPDAPDASVTVAEADKPKEDAPKESSPAPSKKAGPTRVTIGRIPKDARPYASNAIGDIDRSFASDDNAFRDVGPEGSLLVGFRVSYIEKFGGPKVGSAQPIYRSASGQAHYAGRIYGIVDGPVTTVVARPGYAVGGLVTHTGLSVDGFGIVFMQVDGDHLDPGDSYNSPWIGDRKGGSPGQVMSRGDLVVGLQGRAREEVNALGLTALKRPNSP